MLLCNATAEIKTLTVFGRVPHHVPHKNYEPPLRPSPISSHARLEIAESNRRPDSSNQVRCGRTKRSHKFEDLRPGHPYSFQVRAVNNEGVGPWSEPSNPPAWTQATRPAAPLAPALAVSRPPPGPLALWLTIFLPKDDGGAPIAAVLVETREHSGARASEWARCERHPVLPQGGDRDEQRNPSGVTEPEQTSSARARPGTPPGVDNCSGGSSSTGDHSSLSPHHRSSHVVPTCELDVQVGGLKPRTYYSFRASAVNRKGTGDPGPPGRRIRTSPPRPPSWSIEERVAVSAAPVQPRATPSGHCTCSVAWDEPFCNGAPIESYEVEMNRVGAVAADLAPQTNVAPSSLLQPADEITANKRKAGTLRGSPPSEEIVEEPPCSELQVSRLAENEIASVEPGVRNREIIETSVRTVAAHMRAVVIRGLVVHGEYAFRVAGVNVAGRGEPGPWTEMVRIPDPTDEP